MTVEAKSTSRLYYHGTDVEVQLGDRILLRRWLRRPLRGVVCYIPGLSPKHEAMEYYVEADGLDVRQWGIRTDDGTVYAMGYTPPKGQPHKRIVFVSRGASGSGLRPDEPLE